MGHKEPMGLFQKPKNMTHCGQTKEEQTKTGEKEWVLNLMEVLSIKLFNKYSNI